MTKNMNRRAVLKGTATAALLAAARAALPGGAWAATADTPEVKGVALGFIALTDSAPLIIAKEKGFFARHGLPDTIVTKQASWGTTRDNLELGSAGGGIDGAHILTPMPYFMASGKITKNNVKLPMNILARLNVNGQAISVSNAYKDLKIGADAKAFGPALAKARAGGKEIKAAMTFPGGTHDLWLRYWLAASGIDPDHDISTIVVPPPQMVANMKVDAMEAFCVGEPWNGQLVHQNIGFTAMTTGELWRDHPEKSLAVRGDWAEKNPKAARALTAAVMEAQQWCDANLAEMCQIVSGREWFKVPVEDITERSLGTIDYGDGRRIEHAPFAMKYWHDHASYPYQSHELWFLTENQRWGNIALDFDAKSLIKQVNREDIWRQAAKVLALPATDIPASTSRGVEKFFDGKIFDPADPKAYLKSVAIKRAAV